MMPSKVFLNLCIGSHYDGVMMMMISTTTIAIIRGRWSSSLITMPMIMVKVSVAIKVAVVVLNASLGHNDHVERHYTHHCRLMSSHFVVVVVAVRFKWLLSFSSYY